MKYILLLSLLMIPAYSFSEMNISEKPIHLDKEILPGGCATCHYRTYLKSGGGTQHCLYCHGSLKRQSSPPKAIPFDVRPKGKSLKDVEADFKKNYRHPSLDVSGVHRANEYLPEKDPGMPRHADCEDCHNPHYMTRENRFAGVAGGRVGNQAVEAQEERDICYRCHADSANLPVNSLNKKVEFAKGNPSFHPVESEGKNLAVISLIRPYREKKQNPEDVSTLSCSSCHGTDNPDGAKGPHGSIYKGILIDNFSDADMQNESPLAYSLCYRCHSRQSILANESFRFHSIHIAGKTSLGNTGTSCSTCHTSHGSPEYKYLIRFNPSVVTSTKDGKLKFVEKGTSAFSGECYLTCHGVEHNPMKY